VKPAKFTLLKLGLLQASGAFCKYMIMRPAIVELVDNSVHQAYFGYNQFLILPITPRTADFIVGHSGSSPQSKLSLTRTVISSSSGTSK
jgi:hypothetical protein